MTQNPSPTIEQRRQKARETVATASADSIEHKAAMTTLLAIGKGADNDFAERLKALECLMLHAKTSKTDFAHLASNVLVDLLEDSRAIPKDVPDHVLHGAACMLKEHATTSYARETGDAFVDQKTFLHEDHHMARALEIAHEQRALRADGKLKSPFGANPGEEFWPRGTPFHTPKQR